MHRLLFVAPLVVLAACHRHDDASASPPSTSAASSSSPASKLDEARRLALSPPTGMSSVEQAIARQQGIVNADDKNPTRWVVLGELWVRRARESSDPGFYLNADACAELALSLAPDDRLSLDLRAMVLLNDHKFEAARALSRSIADAHPDDPTAFGNLSDALLELGRFEEGAAAVQTMVDLKPNLPSYSRASYVRWLQGDDAAAKDFAKLAMDAGRDEHDREPLCWEIVQAAMIFWHEGDVDGADAGFDKATQLFPDYPPALVGKGRVAIARGDGKRAVELLEKAYAQSPLVETAWLLGDARELAGDRAGADKAFADVERAGKLGDRRTLAAFWATKGKNAKQALDLVEEERKTRGDLYTNDAYAWALYRNGRFADAKTASDHATRLGTLDARLFFHAGAIKIALGDKDAGIALVKKALATQPHFDPDGAAEAQKLVAAP